MGSYSRRYVLDIAVLFTCVDAPRKFVLVFATVSPVVLHPGAVQAIKCYVLLCIFVMGGSYPPFLLHFC